MADEQKQSQSHQIPSQQSVPTPTPPPPPSASKQERSSVPSINPNPSPRREPLASSPSSSSPPPPQQKQAQSQPPRQQASVPRAAQISHTPESEKLEHLDRGEVRTMQKDIAKAREKEAAQERDRISKLEGTKDSKKEQAMVERIRQIAEEQKKKEQQIQQKALQQKQQQTAQEQQQVDQQQQQQTTAGEQAKERLRQQAQNARVSIPNIQAAQESKKEPQSPSSKSGALVRILIILIIAFIVLSGILFGYSQLRNRGIVSFDLSIPSFESLISRIPFIGDKKDPATPPPVPQPAPTPTPPQPTPQPAPAPASAPQPTQLDQLLGFGQTHTIQFTNAQELVPVLNQIVQDSQLLGFSALRLQQDNQNTFSNPQEFFDIFGASIPSNIVSQLNLNNSAFFLHTHAQYGTRIGFVAEVRNATGLQQAFQSWEPNLESAVDNFPSSFWGDKGQGYTTNWRERLHQGVPLRYQTFSTQDTGIVYSFVGNYVVFANSFEATKAMIDQLSGK